MSDFLSFDTFITPKIIRIVFVLGLLLIALSHADPRAVGHLGAQPDHRRHLAVDRGLHRRVCCGASTAS